jgi:hypothetical protein
MCFDALQQHPDAATSAVEAQIKIQEGYSGTLRQEHDVFAFHQPAKYTYLFLIGNPENSGKWRRNLDDNLACQRIECLTTQTVRFH